MTTRQLLLTMAIADHVIDTGHNIKWDHFEILVSGKSDYHWEMKEILFIQDLKPAFNVNISSETLMLYYLLSFVFYCKEFWILIFSFPDPL